MPGEELAAGLHRPVPALVLRQEKTIGRPPLEVGGDDGEKASRNQLAFGLDNIEFEIQAHQVALAAVSMAVALFLLVSGIVMVVHDLHHIAH